VRYSQSHKQETRRKVVRAAAAAVRAKGPDGVGFAEIIAEAGLTHGGFYAHFPSKEALVAAAVEEAFAQSRRRFTRIAEDMSPAQALSAFVEPMSRRSTAPTRTAAARSPPWQTICHDRGQRCARPSTPASKA
jgi:TetR/AcrR family transcriptional repressor of nem operon